MVARAGRPSAWGGHKFDLIRPAFRHLTAAGNAATPYLAFARSSWTLPAVVAYDLPPSIESRRPCCAKHPDRPWRTETVYFAGLGSVVVTGTADGDQPGCDLLARTLPSVSAVVLAVSDRATVPAPARAADPFELGAWAEARLHVALLALAAQFAADVLPGLGEERPLLTRQAALWAFDRGRVARCPSCLYDLEDPAAC